MADSSDILSADTAQIKVGLTVETAVDVCRQGDWERGLQLLWKASRRAGKDGELPAVFYSYAGFGVARFQHHLGEGERMCRRAVELEPDEPEHLLLLAEVCLLRRKRSAAVKALRQGLRLAPDDPQLLRLERRIGSRRPPVIGFLHRDHFLNRLLGRLRHRRATAD